MQDQIMTAMNINSTQYGLVTSMIAIPSIFISLATGLIADRVGVLTMMIPIVLLLSLGMAIQTAAIYKSDFQLLLAGRFVFALGYEPISLVKGLVVNDWFFGKELSTANSINLSFCRGIVFVSGAFTPLIESNFSLTSAFGAGCVVCLISLTAANVLHSYQTSLENERTELEKVDHTFSTIEQPEETDEPSPIQVIQAPE